MNALQCFHWRQEECTSMFPLVLVSSVVVTLMYFFFHLTLHYFEFIQLQQEAYFSIINTNLNLVLICKCFEVMYSF